MLRISKYVCAAVLSVSLLLPVSAPALETVITPEEMERHETHYRTAAAENGVYEESVSSTAVLSYTRKYYLNYDGPAARFEKFYVRSGDEVKEGQCIASFVSESDPTLLYQKQLQLQRAQETREAQLTLLSRAISEKQAQIRQAQDIWQQRQYQLEAEKAAVRYDQYDLESSREIAQLQMQVEELIEDSKTQYLYAPGDGVVEKLTYFTANQAIQQGQRIAVLYDPDTVCAVFDNSSGKMRYHMPVTLTARIKSERVEFSGVVIASGNVLPGSQCGDNRALILMELPAETARVPSSPNVRFTYRRVENVTLINRQTVTLFAANNSVYILRDNGSVSKRNITQVQGNGSTLNWVLQGVQPGDMLVLK